jgi:leucyl aminopeptidase (aminopeptidase T)
MLVQDAELIENARKPLELNVSEDDAVLILSDTGMDPRMWSIFNTAARSLGFDPVVMLMPELEYDNAEPPEQVKQAMINADVCVSVASNSVSHTDAGMAAAGSGTYFIAMEEITPDIITGPGFSADYERVYEIGKQVRQRWNDGSTVHLSSPNGMDLEASIDGRPAYLACGRRIEQPKCFNVDGTSFPAGETPIAPIEGTANGTIVWDVSMYGIGAIDEPIVADVEDGYVTDIRGGREASELASTLESSDSAESYNLAEISIGLNPELEPRGHIREDKDAWGYVHLAVGTNSDICGKVNAPIHIDGVAGDVTLTIDGYTVVERGEILN